MNNPIITSFNNIYFQYLTNKVTFDQITFKYLYYNNGVVSIQEPLKTISLFNNNKCTLLYFWWTDCEYCLEGLLKLNKIYTNNSKITIFGVNNNNNITAEIALFINKYKIKMPLLLDEQNILGEKLAVYSVPSLFLFDEKHNLIGHANGKINYNYNFDDFIKIIENYNKYEWNSQADNMFEYLNFSVKNEYNLDSAKNLNIMLKLSFLLVIVCLFCYIIFRYLKRAKALTKIFANKT